MVGNISSPGSGVHSEKFGSGASLGSSEYATAIGSNSVAAQEGTAVGYQAQAATYSTAFGVASNSGGVFSVAIGKNATTSGNFAVALGMAAAAGDTAVAIGKGVTASDNQLNIGNLIFATGLSKDLIASTGNVGIRTTAPASALQVNGAITNTVSTFSGAYTCGSTTIDFAVGNFVRFAPSGVVPAGPCTTLLTGLTAGGSYTLIVTGNAAINPITYDFSGYTFKYLPGNSPTVAGKDTIYTLLFDGVTVYVTWSGGY